MKTPLECRKTAIVLLGALMLRVHAPLPARSETVPDAPGKSQTLSYEAHEWGTFTSIQGSDGTPLPWRPFTTSDLPAFVHRRDRPTRNPGFLARHRDDITVAGLKESGTWLQRMETPVIYFHADQAMTVDVDVAFPSGRLTEWFPQVTAYGPSGGNPDRSFLRWEQVRVLDPKESREPGRLLAIPGAPGDEHYAEARRTSANLVEVTRGLASESIPQMDRLLFYRGAGNFTAPLHLSVDRSGRLVLANTGTTPLGPLFAVRTTGGRPAFSRLGMIAVGATETLASPGSRQETAPDPAATSQGDPETGALAEAMIDALTEAGLHRDEAQAMVSTWKRAWFGEDGTRVLYLLPRPWTDQVLPLRLQPEPRRLVRVMVGRAEVFPRTLESRVSDMVAGFAGGDEAWNLVALQGLGLGRFLEPAVTRAAALVRENAKSSLFSCSTLPAREFSLRLATLDDTQWTGRMESLRLQLARKP